MAATTRVRTATKGERKANHEGSPKGSGRPRRYRHGYQFTKATGNTKVSALRTSRGKIVIGYCVIVFPP